MANVSLNGEDIILNKGLSYFVIDALYLSGIKNELTNVSMENFEMDIRTKVFPYNETPFAIISLDNIGDQLKKISINKIRKTEDEDIGIGTFSTDTGLIVIVERSILTDLVKYFDYDKLVEEVNGPINQLYWNDIEETYGKYNCGIILSPGIKKGFDFDGSGLYRIEV